jgi:hypothetical protein
LWKRDPAAPLVGEAHAKIVVPAEARGGFEFWEGFESGFLLNDPWLHGTRLPEPVKIPGYQSDVVCARAAAWISAKENRAAGTSASAGSGRRPWLCVVSLEAPHPPYDAPAGGAMRLESADVILPSTVPRGGEVEARARRELAGYYAHIQATDTAVGRLCDALKAADVDALSNTLIVFTSVHGDMHGAHGFFRKGWPHEEAVRVPLLLRLPEGIPEQRDDAISLAELRGMLIHYADHLNLGAAGRKNAAHISMPSVVALPHQCDRKWRGLRTATRKLVLNDDGSPWLFFDLSRDPGETKNLVGDVRYVGEIAELRRRLDDKSDSTV